MSAAKSSTPSNGSAGRASAWQEPGRSLSKSGSRIGRSKASKEATSSFPLRLQAEEDGIRLDLRLTDLRGRVYQGDDGYSRKGPEEGNASFYYSYPRLEAEGRVTLGGESSEVQGTAWLDREWSTSALGEDVLGWDWFSLQLDDDREVMLFELRRRDGEEDPWNECTIIEADGSTRRVAPEGVSLEVTDRWKSGDSVTYPSGWRLRIPSENLDLTLEPRLKNQGAAAQRAILGRSPQRPGILRRDPHCGPGLRRAHGLRRSRRRPPLAIASPSSPNASSAPAAVLPGIYTSTTFEGAKVIPWRLFEILVRRIACEARSSTTTAIGF